MAARVRLNSAGVREVLNSPATRSELTSRAEAVLAAAKAGAPVVSGEYRNGLHLEQDTTDRAVVRVVGRSDHDMAVEANTGNLARALDAAG